MKKNTLYALAAAIAILSIVVGVVVQMRRHTAAAEAHKAAEFEIARKQAVQAAAPESLPPRSSNMRPLNNQGQDPEARTALALVGSEAVSEQYWASAINNPALPAKERQDLIEDLNEEGISDPKHPTADDLKVIKNRIKIIEELSPLALDDVNAAAFKEAHKDLTEMLMRANR